MRQSWYENRRAIDAQARGRVSVDDKLGVPAGQVKQPVELKGVAVQVEEQPHCLVADLWLGVQAQDIVDLAARPAGVRRFEAAFLQPWRTGCFF